MADEWSGQVTTHSAESRHLLKKKKPTCHSVHHKSHIDRPLNRTGLKIRPENDEAESSLSQNGGTTSALTRQYGETAEIRLATRGTNVSYFNLECEWAHVGHTKIGLRGRLLKTYSGLKWIRHDLRASFCYYSDELWLQDKECLG